MMKRTQPLLHCTALVAVLLAAPVAVLAQSAPGGNLFAPDNRKLTASEALAEADAAKAAQSAGQPAAAVQPTAAAPQPALPAIEPLPPSQAKPFYALMKVENYQAQMGSLFFTPEQQTLLDRIYRLLEQGKKEEAVALAGGARQDPMDTLMGKSLPPAQANAQQKQVIPPDVPMFYLSSIMYISPNEWALWVNGKRFTASRPSTPDGKFEVIGVSPTEASFVWTPYRFAQIAALINAQHQQEVSKANQASGMEIVTSASSGAHAPKATTVPSMGRLGTEEATRRIFFTLRTNQSFYTLPPRIAEGLPFRDVESINALPLTTVLPSAHAPMMRQVTPPPATNSAPALAPVTNPPQGDAAALPAADASMPVAPGAAPQQSSLSSTAPAAEAPPIQPGGADNAQSPGTQYREVDGLIQRQ